MLETGQLIQLPGGRYTLTTPIASSSFGHVWAARSRWGKDVAMKFVRVDQMQLAAPQDQGRWQDGLAREARFLQNLSRQETRHIVRLIDYGQWEGLPVLVMEKMADTLANYIHTLRSHGERLPLNVAVDWMVQASVALQVIHAHGFRYLDLKPANLLLSRDARILKAADFGCNRPPADLLGHSFVGTLGWQAPEQFYPVSQGDGSKTWSTDFRSDFFALGMLFYYLVTTGDSLRFACDCLEEFHRNGGRPGDNAKALRPLTLHPAECQHFLNCIDQSAQGIESCVDSTWHANIAPDAPTLASQAEALLKTLLAQEPDQRPKDIHAIIAALGAIQKLLGNTVPSPIPPAASPARTPIWLPRLLVTASAVAALSAGAWVAEQPWLRAPVDAWLPVAKRAQHLNPIEPELPSLGLDRLRITSAPAVQAVPASR